MEEGWRYPTTQINGAQISKNIEYLDLIIGELSEEQNVGYEYVLKKYKEDPRFKVLNEPKTGIQYTAVDGLQQSLNIIYPISQEEMADDINKESLYGKTGLNRMFEYNKSQRSKDFRYKDEILEKYGRILSTEGDNDSLLKKYSSKIYSIMETIKNSKGIVLIYSNYIYGGCVPIALALEEMGITRLGDKSKSLFRTPPVDPFMVGNKSAKYAMITGDKMFSPSNKNELEACTDINNINGESVKVIIISKAGSEGLDFKNIRQVHILEPWFNLNRSDQTIGRAVRNKSHCNLPFNERNVQIFLYGSELKNRNIEAIDLYVYRLAEYKSIQIGKVSRVLKQNAVDCLLNKNQQQMVSDKLNKQITLSLSTGKEIEFSIGHKNNSLSCDFMNCTYDCEPINDITGNKISNITYFKNFITMNIEKIMKRIKMLFREQYVYKKSDLKKRIKAIKNYSNEQIITALNTLITDKNEYLVDVLNRQGKLVNIGEYYLFQPIDIDNKYITNLERRKPQMKKQLYVPIILSENKNNASELKVNTVKKSEYEDILSLYDLFNKSIISQLSEDIKKSTNIWSNYSGHVINNLIHYNKLNKTLLIQFCLEHLFDSIKDIDDKLNVINSYENIKRENKQLLDIKSDSFSGESKSRENIEHEVKWERFLNILELVLNKFIIVKEDKKLFVVADYQKKYTKKNSLPYHIFKFNNEINKYEPNYISANDDLISKFYYKSDMSKDEQTEIRKLNTTNDIGFLTKNKSNTNIIFKLKSLERGKREGGTECISKGIYNTVKINRINELINEINKINKIDLPIKYYMLSNDGRSKRNLDNFKIYGNDFVQVDENGKELYKNSKKREKMSSMQLCVETELLLRYLDNLNEEREDGIVNGKKWFLSTVESVINRIEKLYIK